MNLIQFAWKNLSGNAFRSWVVAICALLVSAFALFGTLLLRGASTSLQLASDRLGADIVVVPQGAETDVEGAIMMGVAAKMWMPSRVVGQLAVIPDVQVASPQIYLETLTGADCCSVPHMFMVAYDPATDFTVRPWLKGQDINALELGEVVGGSNISATEGQNQTRVYGYLVTLRANLVPTGTGLDQSMFFTIDTGRDIARISKTAALSPLEIPKDQVSAVLIKVKPGADAKKVALYIMHAVPGVTPIVSDDMFQSSRKQLTSLIQVMAVLISITWVMTIILTGLLFSMAANERRRELGVLRALGATRQMVSQTLLSEALILALIGASVGSLLAVIALFFFRTLIMTSLGLPFLLPGLGELALQIGAGLLVTLLSVFLAALLPAIKISRMDPAIAMRE